MKKKENANIPQNENMLNDDELRILRASVEADKKSRKRLPHYDNSDTAKLARYVKSNKIFAAVCVVLALCIVTVMVLGIVLAVKKASQRENTDDYTVMIGTETYTAKYKTAMRNGVFYIDMYPIAKYADLTVTGSKSNVKFTASEDNYLRFEDGSDTAVINGAMVELGGTAVVSADVCEVPFEFLTKAIGDGLKLTLDKETNTVKIKRLMYQVDKDEYTPVDVLFSSDYFSVIQAIQRPETPDEFEYSIDVSAFLDSIDPVNSEEYLILANKQTPLGEDYAPSDLKRLNCRTADSNRNYQLREDAADALYVMMLAMNAEGITDVYVTSAYRTYSYQKNLFDKYVNGHMSEGMSRDEAIAAALEYSASPGTSEHQTGLCLDFMTDDMLDLDETFEDTDAFEWLSENVYKYGFILRYPEDKVDITEYKYEPWHYRFVGRTVATEIYTSGLCLEEYLELN